MNWPFSSHEQAWRNQINWKPEEMRHPCNSQAGNTPPALSLGQLRRRRFVSKRQHFETWTCYAVCPNEWLEWIPLRAFLRKCRIRNFTDRFPYRMGNICERFTNRGKLMLKLKPQNFGQVMQRIDSFENTLMEGKIEGGKRRGQQRMR